MKSAITLFTLLLTAYAATGQTADEPIEITINLDSKTIENSQGLEALKTGDWKEMLVAAQNGDLPLVRYHIRMGENPNYQHPEFLTTPLIEAATFGHLEIAQFLLDNGAKPELKAGFSSDTALTMAQQHKHTEIVKLLKSVL